MKKPPNMYNQGYGMNQNMNVNQRYNQNPMPMPDMNYPQQYGQGQDFPPPQNDSQRAQEESKGEERVSEKNRKIS